MKAMVIDDSKTMRSIQKTVLLEMGVAEVAEATNGAEGLEKVYREKPDFILLDWNMPHADGITFLMAYRQIDKTTPVMMITTESEKPRVIKALQAGASNYLIKPFEPESLKEKIRLMLQKANVPLPTPLPPGSVPAAPSADERMTA